MVFDSVDFGKARLLLGYLARSHKKIKERTQSLKIIRDDILQIKRATGKSNRAKIAKLEKKIIDALKKGGFVEECEEKQEFRSEQEIALPEEAPQEEIIAEEHPEGEDINREEKLREIEEQAKAKAETVVMSKDAVITDLSSALERLEKIKKTIKVKSKSDKEKLQLVSGKVKSLKAKLSRLRGKNIEAPAKKVKKKTVVKKTKRIKSVLKKKTKKVVKRKK